MYAHLHFYTHIHTYIHTYRQTDRHTYITYVYKYIIYIHICWNIYTYCSEPGQIVPPAVITSQVTLRSSKHCCFWA